MYNFVQTQKLIFCFLVMFFVLPFDFRASLLWICHPSIFQINYPFFCDRPRIKHLPCHLSIYNIPFSAATLLVITRITSVHMQESLFLNKSFCLKGKFYTFMMCLSVCCLPIDLIKIYPFKINIRWIRTGLQPYRNFSQILK